MECGMKGAWHGGTGAREPVQGTAIVNPAWGGALDRSATGSKKELGYHSEQQGKMNGTPFIQPTRLQVGFCVSQQCPWSMIRA